jgi:hypothetical protein
MNAGHSLLISELGGISNYRDSRPLYPRGRTSGKSRTGDWVGQIDNVHVLQEKKSLYPERIRTYEVDSSILGLLTFSELLRFINEYNITFNNVKNLLVNYHHPLIAQLHKLYIVQSRKEGELRQKYTETVRISH